MPVTIVPNASTTADRRWRIAAVAAIAWAVAATSYGQPSPLAGPSRPGEAASSISRSGGPGEVEAESSAAEPAFGLLRPEDGAVAPLPAGTTYEDFLAWVAAKRGPGYGINSVSLTARPSGEASFEVLAEVGIIVHRKGDWVRVPLAFDEATLTAFEHEGQGACSFSRQPDETGHAWSFDTAGEHTLRVTLLVPVVTRSEEVRLVLTTATDAAVTSVRLELPLEADVTAGKGIVRSITSVGGRTDVDWVGPGGHLDLTWRPKPVAAALDSLAAETTILPSANGRNIQLRVRQRIQATKGEISSVTVLLPDGYALTDVTGALVRPGSRREDTTDGGRKVTVPLSEATAGPFELVWQLTAPLPEDGLITLSGFTLPGVPDGSQTGRILIEPSGAYRISAPTGGAAEGVTPLEMVEPESVPVSGAYQFRQPFRFGLKVEPVPPELQVSRKLTVVVEPDEHALEAELGVEVVRGEAKELDLIWPASDWTVSPIRSMNVAEGARGMDPGAFRLRVTNPAARFTVPFKASLARDATAETALPLPLLRSSEPGSKSAYGETNLCLRHSDGLAVHVDVSGSGRLHLQSDAAVASLGLADPPPGERWTVYRAEPEVSAISLRVSRLPVTISAALALAVRPQGDHLFIRQQFDYDIDHGSVSELEVRPPLDALGLRFTDAGGKPLTSLTRSGTETSALILDLGRRVTGPLSVVAEYQIPQEAATGSSTVRVPLARPVNAEVGSVSLRVSPPAGRDASVADTGWTRLTTTDGGPSQWTTSIPIDSVSIRLMPRADGPKGPSASRLLLTTEVNLQGTADTTAECRIDHPTRYLSLHFAEGVVPDSYAWQEQPLRGLSLQQHGQQGVAVELDLGADPTPGVLRFTFRSKAADAPGLAEMIAVPSFRFGPGITTERTLWQVTLPDSQHLFTSPRGYIPRFHWTFKHGLWTRQPTPPFDNPSAWFNGESNEAKQLNAAGRRYVFSHDGPPQLLSFTVISRSLVVLIGAGAAIVLGYVFVNGLVPYRRVATIALAVALVLLWGFFPDQVQIFLQPAAFGLLLVFVAAVAERLLRKRQEQFAPITTPTSAVDFVTILPGESSTSAPQAPIGSEEPTVLRHGRPSTVEPVGSDGQRP